MSISLLVLPAAMFAATTGGCGCGEPMSDDAVPISEATLSSYWSDPDHGGLTIAVAAGPYPVSGTAVDKLASVLMEQARLEVTVAKVGAADLPKNEVVSFSEAQEAARALVSDPSGPTLIVVEVFDSGFGYYGQCGYTDWADRTVVVLYSRKMNTLLGKATTEAQTLIHEIGHWLEIPARPYHTSEETENGLHCTRCNCSMTRPTAGAIFANLLSGPPLSYCDDCREELAELARRRTGPRAETSNVKD